MDSDHTNLTDDVRSVPGAHRGRAARVLLASLVFLGLAGPTLWWTVRRDQTLTHETPLLTSVVRGPYEHIVIEQGEIESSNNVEVRCEVKNRSGGNNPSTTILEVIPEGTTVKKGDWLITFDSRRWKTNSRNRGLPSRPVRLW